MVVLTNDGLAVMAKLLGGVDSVAPFTYIAVGSGSTAESAAQTALVTELTTNGFARAAVTPTFEASGAKCVWHKVFTSEADGVSVQEIGLFNAASGVTMGLRALLTAAKVIDTGETLDVTIKIGNAQGA